MSYRHKHVRGVCRLCGCTDADCTLCVERTGEPCTWVDYHRTRCSACYTASGKERRGAREEIERTRAMLAAMPGGGA